MSDIKSDAATPGQAAEVSAYAQAAFDAFWSSPALGEEPPSPLNRESAGIRNAWERAVGAVLKDAFPGLRRELNEARAAVAAQDARPAPGMHPLTGLIANSYALYKFAQGGEWLTCEDDGRLDMRKELLAVKAAVREALKGTPEPEPVPELAGAIQDIIDRYPEQQPAPVSPAGPELPRVIDITGEVLTAAVQGKRIMLQLGSGNVPKPAPGLAAAIDPAKLDLLADWFDVDDLAKDRAGRTEVQDDLRRWAKLVRDARELPS